MSTKIPLLSDVLVMEVDNKYGNEPEQIRLLEEDGKTCVDIIDAKIDDAFCLDPFSELIKSYQCNDPPRNLIIARVQYEDETDPEKILYSYYDAYHLNRLLFQNQMRGKVKLLHRLEVKNPMTNTEMVGPAEYFMVVTKYSKPQSVNPAQQSIVHTRRQSVADGNIHNYRRRMSSIKTSTKDRPGPELIRATVIGTSNTEDTRTSYKNESSHKNNEPNFKSNIPLATIQDGSIPMLNLVKQAPQLVSTFDAIRIGNDDQYLDEIQLRTLFKENALDPQDCVLMYMDPVKQDELFSSQPFWLQVFGQPTEGQLYEFTPLVRLFHIYKYWVSLIILISVTSALIASSSHKV